MKGRWGDGQDRGGLSDVDQITRGGLGRRFESRNLPVRAQAADPIGREAEAGRGSTTLAIENAGNDRVWIVHGQAAHQIDGLLVGANRWRLDVPQRDVEFAEKATAPPQREMRLMLGLVDRDDDLLEQCAQQFLAIAIGRGRCRPYAFQITSQRQNGLTLVRLQHPRALSLAAREFGFRGMEHLEASLPFGFKAACDETIGGINGAIAPLRALRVVARAFDIVPALGHDGVVIGVDVGGGEDRRLEPRRGDGCQKGRRDGGINLATADAQAILAAPVDDDATGTVIPGRGVTATVVHAQPAPTPAARGEALQQGHAFSHGASRLVRTGARVTREARLIRLERVAVDEAGMMIRDAHGPLARWQSSQALAHAAGVVDVSFASALAVDVGASIHGIAEDLMNLGVRRRDPANRTGGGLRREAQILGTEPEPHLARRSHLGEALEDDANRGGDALIGMEADLAVLLTPDEADGQAATQFAPRRFVADATTSSRARNTCSSASDIVAGH
jgi:hypothetical protein